MQALSRAFGKTLVVQYASCPPGGLVRLLSAKAEGRQLLNRTKAKALITKKPF